MPCLPWKFRQWSLSFYLNALIGWPVILFLEFREKLELVERTSPLMAKLEFDEQVEQAEKVLTELKQQFDKTLDEKLKDANQTKADNFEQLRPVLGHPSRKNELQELDQREKQRQETIKETINQLRSNTMVGPVLGNGRYILLFSHLYRKIYKLMLRQLFVR